MSLVARIFLVYMCGMYINKFFGTYVMEDETRSKLQVSAWFKAQSANVIHKKPFEPKESECSLTDIKAVVLNINP